MNDLIVRGGAVVLETGVVRGDIAIDAGRIVAIGAEVGGARSIIDATGLHVFPGLVDVHVHFNEPGRTDWEGAATGSHALAAGGGTLFFDMPLNSAPCTVTPHDFDQKRQALERSSVADFGLWGGLVPGAVESMPSMADRGVVGFKAFMCDSGLPEFPRVDDRTLLDGLTEAARLGLPIAVHAENEALTRRWSSALAAEDVAAWCRSRPVVAEVEAIGRAILLAEEAGARLHIVHASSGRAVTIAAEARLRGVDVTVETCPHYLFFTEDDMVRLGAVAKCAPPLRARAVQEELWRTLLAGQIDLIASDHSPAPPELKQAPFAAAWGGIAGVQSTLSVLIARGYHDRGLSLERIATLTAGVPARRFGIEWKGAIAPGFDADLALVDLTADFTLEARGLQQRHALSPYVGQPLRGAVRRTIRRGETVHLDGRAAPTGGGRLVRPSRTI